MTSWVISIQQTALIIGKINEINLGDIMANIDVEWATTKSKALKK